MNRALIATIVLSLAVFARAQEMPPVGGALPPAAREADLDEHLGQAVHTNLVFTDQTGHQARLSDYFRDGKPVIVVLAYFRCNMLCDLVLRGLVDGLRAADRIPGKDFRVLTVSFDPQDKPNEALNKQHTLLQVLGHPEAVRGWPFLVGDDANIKALADDLGFRYGYDPSTKQYAHPAAIFVLSPNARITRYLYGFQFAARDLRLAIAEAGEGKVGPIIDRILLTCYHYDPATHRYGFVLSGILRGGSLAVLLIVGGGLGVLWRRERRRPR